MPALFSWGNTDHFILPLRRFAAGVAVAFFLAVPVAQANHLPAPITITTLIPFDDLLIPVPTPFHPDGMAKQADFNGDGRTDLLVQAPNGSGTSYLFLADANNKYTAIAQSWNASYLGLNWGADASTLYAGDYNGDGRADLIVESKAAGGRNGLIYSGPGGVMDTVYQTWDTPVPPGTAPTGLATNSTTAVDAITIFTLIPFDDLLIPVPVAFNPDGIRFKADLNGDGIADIFIQARNPGGSNHLLYGARAADGSIKYTSIGQSWTDGHLGLNWNAQAVTLRVENGQITAWTGSGADQTVWRFTPDASGKINAITQTWANAAGATAGSFDVTPTGAASYTIPIAVPPGVNGMAPSLSLQYNSQSGNGLLGMGWNINGLSAIHHCPRTIAQDGTTGTVNFDANDRFCLDGQRLMVVGAATDYGAVGKEYRTEIESFARVVSSGGTAGDPQSFTVYTKDGKIIEYGVTTDARIEAEGKTQARVWAANKIRDRKNNAITIAYTENSTQGEYYPRRIDYPKGRSVQFTYEARTDDNSGYMGGSKVSITQRLAGIQTVVNMRGADSVVRSYKLAYEQGTATGRSRLTSIQECTPSECLTPTRFGWQEGGKGFGAFASTGSGHAAKDELGDFNGDGKADIYQFTNGAGSVWLSDGSGYPTSQAIGSGYLKEADGEQWLADINGDGRTDVISAYGLKSVWDTNSPLYNARLKSRFWPAPQTATAAGMEFFAYGPDQQVAFTRSDVQVGIAASQYNVGGGAADFDGDGKADVLWAKPIRNPSTLSATGLDWVVGYSTGSTAIDPIVTLSSSDTLSFIANGDFNGDGRTDLISSDGAVWFSTGREFNKVKPKAPGEVPSGVNFSIGDFNGDGKADILYLGGNASSISIKLSTGINFKDSGWSLGGITTSAAARKVADINGDGKSDVIEFGVDSAKVWLSTGKGFVAEQWGQKGNAAGDKLGDVNGDGRLDVVNFNNGSANVALAKGAAPDVLRTIINGLGARIEADYMVAQGNLVFAGSSGANQIPNVFGPAYTINGTGASAPDFRYNSANSNVPLQVISKYSVSNGIGGINTVDYSYGTSSIDRAGRGFLGFASITAVDKRAGLSDITTVTGYRQDFPFIGLVSSIQKKQGTALLYSVNNTWSSRSSDARIFPYISYSAETNNDTNGTTNITTRGTTASYNPYGNPSTINVTTSGGGTVYTQSTGNEYYVNEFTTAPATTEWYKIGQLKSASVRNTASRLWGDSANEQGPSTRTTEYTYYADGLLKDEILEPANALLKQTTTYGYDGFGNRISATVSGRANVADSASATLSRTSTTDYGPDGQFPVRAVNPAGHVATSVFDARFGTITRLVDANGLVTTRGYDSFGRLASEVRPDGTQSAVSYNRCNFGCQGNDAYYVTTTATGQPTSTVYYDMLGRETRRTTQGFNGGLVSKETQYDALGRTVYTARNHYQSDAAYATRYEYDVLNRVTKETAPDNGVTGYAYNGLATTITNVRNYKTTRYTNALGKLIRVTDAKSGNTSYDYDLFGNLRFIRDPASHDTVMTYNVRGHKTGMKDPDRGSLAWQTNAFGDIVKQTDAKGQIVTMDYDTLGRMTKRTEAEGTSQWTWDTAAQGRGKLAQATGPGGYKRVHTYDNLSRPVRTSSTLAGAIYDIDTGYDQYGRIGSVGYPFTATNKRLTVYNSYTATGYLSEVKNAASSGTVYWKASGVDAEGRITQETLGNGLATTRSFDPLGRVKSIATGSTIQNLAYVYDATGNLTSRKDTVQNLTESFGYDELNRLTSVTGPAPRTYAYSADGNITAKSDMGDQYLYGATATPTGTPAGPHAVTSIKKAGTLIGSYSYDANGNVRTAPGKSFTYTSYNLPSAITQGTATATFTYDADHARATQVAGGETTVYLNPRWDDGIHFEKTTKASGLIEHRHYLYAGNTPIALYTTRSDNTSSTRYLHKDHLGSVDAITSETGALVERLSYDAWGKRRQGNGLDATAPIAAATTHHGYTGHEHLDGLGLIHMNARVYDPGIGRFLQADPIGFEGGLNLYGYAEGNPTSLVDLSGLETGYVSNCSQRGTCATPQTSFSVVASIIDFFTGSNVNRVSIGCCGPQFDRPIERLTPELWLLMPIRAETFARGVANKFDLPELTLSRDPFAIKATVAGDPKAFFRAELPSSGVVEVTDIFRGGLPKGSGGEFLAQAVKGHGDIPTQQLVFKGIVNEPTIATFKAGADPATSVLGVTGTRALESLGITPTGYRFEVVRGKLNLVIDTK